MKLVRRIFIPIITIFIYQNSFCQLPTEKGVTIIVHGFTLPQLPWQDITDWIEYTKNIRDLKGGSGASAFRSNSAGQWEAIDGNPGSGSNPHTIDPNKEIVLLYDWAALSNDGLFSSSFGGNGALESAADNLFASLLAPPLDLNIPYNSLLSKRIHLIGHSRGCILLLQLCHRLKRYFPNFRIDQLTLLDPHPATTFGDVHSVLPNGEVSPNNLPCVYGNASSCENTLGCSDGSQISLKIPDNVTQFDGYYRRDGLYEGVLPGNGYFNFAAFDGVNIGGPRYYQLDDGVILNGSSAGGGSHSGVHKWYFGTFVNTITNSNILNWYSPSVGGWFTGGRGSNGFYYSRLGGGTLPSNIPPYTPNYLKTNLAEMDAKLLLRGNGGGLQRVFNGNFAYNNLTGWYGKGGVTDGIAPNLSNVNGANFYNLPGKIISAFMLKHNFMYFGGDINSNSYQTLRFSYVSQISNSVIAGLKIRFYNSFGYLISTENIDVVGNNNSIEKIVRVNIPTELRNRTGTFSIENETPGLIKLGRFDLLTSTSIPTASNTLEVNFNRTFHTNNLVWQDFATDETGYTVERSYNEDGPWAIVATLGVNANSYSELATFPNTVYWYKVKASSPTLTNTYTNQATDTSSNIPNRPFPLIVTTPGINSRIANLSWVDNDNFETGYDIFYSFNRYGPYDTLVKLPANTTSYQHTNTPLGSRIFYFVKAVEVNYFSLPSDTGLVNFQTLPSRTLSTIEWNIDNINTGWSSINVSGFYAVDRTLNVSMLGYSNGVHTLYVKSTDNTGKQSNIFTQTFLRTIGDNGANKILKFAYYFDDDNPAITNPINVSTLSYDVSNISGNDFSFPINISSLNDGLHSAHLRALDNLGTWSNVWSGTFIKLPGGGTKEITKVEYFVDTDPGFGLAFNVPINAKEKIDTTLNFGLGSVSDGVHTLFMRAKDAQGLWSNVFSKNFMRFQGASGKAIAQIEYYFDTDPGIGSGLHINFPVPRANADTIVTLNLATLVDGLHTLYARAKDVKGLWSNIYSKSFLKMQGTGGLPKITKMEYYIDSDPGLGLASNIDTTGHSNGIYNLNIPINTLSDGEHTLYIRAKDNRSLWSIVYSGVFRKVNDLDCPCAKIVYGSGLNTASAYQWQVDDGTGFQNIADSGVYFGTRLDSLKISNPPTTFSFNKYRCAITTGAGLIFSDTFVLRYNMRWTGNDNTEWNTISNWGCYTLPDDKTDVTVPGNKVNYPEINSNKSVNSIKLNAGSSLQISVGVTLDIKSRQN